MNEKRNTITLRAFVLGTFFAALFAVLTVYMTNTRGTITNSTQISVLPYLLVMVTVLLLNPLCRLIRIIRAFSTVEIMVIFIMGMVSSGLSVYGLDMPLVTIVGDLCNPEWNNRQSEWNRYVVPLLNDRYFLAEPGTQAAAGEYNRTLTSALKKRMIYEAACRVGDYTKLVSTIESEIAAGSGSDQAKNKALKASLESARRLHADSLRQWQDLRARDRDLPEWQEVIRLFPGQIDREKDIAEEAEKKLLALEQPAFEQVRIFRHGLPRGKSAFPGILPFTDDNYRTYFGRLRRLIGGMEAFSEVKQTWKSASCLPAEKIINADLGASYSEHLARAQQVLSALNNYSESQLLKDRLQEREKELAERRMQQSARLRAISEQKRTADRQQTLLLNNQSDEIFAEIKNIERQYKDFKNDMGRCRHEMDCAENIQLLTARINELEKMVSSGGMRSGELAVKTADVMSLFPAVDISLRRYFFGQVPWKCWLKPLARWAVLVALTYVMLMALNMLIFRQWAYNERLTYPLAELPKTLIGDPEVTGLPPVFRSGLFWAGAAISMSVMGWNLFCSTQIVPGLSPLNFTMPYLTSWQDYVVNTKFEALRNVRTEVFFTMVGLSFLVPKNISFSLWFFYVVYLLELLLMVWSGHGVDARSFPADWWTLANFRMAQGQGAILIFAGSVLYKCRKYILCAFFPSSVADLDAEEQKELKLSSIAFLGCSFGLIMILWLSMGANLYYTIFFYLILLFIAIFLTRGAAEGGLLFYQIIMSPFHYIRTFFGFNRDWTSASLFAPLMVYYAVFFLDIKSLISPAMANALKLREDFRIKRLSFHVIIAVAIIVASVASIAVNIMMCYDRGADTMYYSWFFFNVPRDQTFGTIRSLIKDAPMASVSNMIWTTGGGLGMVALLFFRQYFFWLPHPLGMVMLLNGLMDGHWFSIFLGWLCNVAVTKYGNKDSFHRAKGFFIGLIAGELIIVIASFIVEMTMGVTSGIRFDRH